MCRIFIACFLGIPGFAGCGQSEAPSLEGIKQEIRGKFPAVEHLPIETFVQWVQEGRSILLVDVREESEFRVSHLAGSINLRLPQEIQRHHQEGDYSAIVVYCSVGYRSAQMARRLSGLDLDSVFNLEGSIFEWANQGRSVFDTEGEVDAVHPYDATWGELLRPRLRGPLK